MSSDDYGNEGNGNVRDQLKPTIKTSNPYLWLMRPNLKSGHNVDELDVSAGLRELAACGYSDPKTIWVVDYALVRHARGEEDAALRGAVDAGFFGISLTCWYRVLAAAASPRMARVA